MRLKTNRRIGLVALAVSALLSSCATQPPPASTSTPSGSSDAFPTQTAPGPVTPQASGQQMTSCQQTAAALPLAAQVGELFMVGVQVGSSADAVSKQLTEQHIGSIILLGQREGLANVQAETQIYQTRFPELLIAADQEGGVVQRLAGAGFETIPAAQDQAGIDDVELRANWQRYAREMRNAGVRYDLAPVADVVPADQVASNAPVGQLRRGYGSDPQVVSNKTQAVIQGLSDGRVASSVKHFPGLGKVPENTDFAVGHDRSSQLSPAELQPFADAIDAGASSVMVSSAIYEQVDPANPAVFSKTIIETILRGQLGFDRVVISDDLGAAVAVANVPAGERATRFFQAGGDLLISADPELTTQMIQATLAMAASDPQFAAELTTKAGRVLKLKNSVGLVSCS